MFEVCGGSSVYSLVFGVEYEVAGVVDTKSYVPLCFISVAVVRVKGESVSSFCCVRVCWGGYGLFAFSV